MSMMSAITAAAPLVPGKRGGRRCVCHGTFVSMHKGAGWVKPIEEIDHPSAAWNQGDVYLSEKDIIPGVNLEKGDSVVFHLYVDAKGLGAQNCSPIWHEKAQAMRATRNAKEISISQSALLPSVHDIAMASAILTASAAMQTTAPTPKAPPGLAPPNLAVDLSNFYDAEEEQDDDESDYEEAPTVTIRLADALPHEPKEPPSVGSALHAEGNCKRCSFFPKGTCSNGADCEFCHYEHEKRPQNHKRKRLWRERQREKAQLARAEAERLAVAARTPMKEPMKISSFSMVLPKDLCTPASGNRTPTNSTDDGSSSADEGSAPRTPKSSDNDESVDVSYNGSEWGTPPTLEREPCLKGGILMPPKGRSPPPSFPPPPKPVFLADAMLACVEQETSK